MTIILLTLLIITLAIIGAGVLLSSRPGTAQRLYSQLMDLVRDCYMYLKRFANDFMRSETWAKTKALLDVHTFFVNPAKKQTPWLGALIAVLMLLVVSSLVAQPATPALSQETSPAKSDVVNVAPARSIIEAKEKIEKKTEKKAEAKKFNASNAIERIAQLNTDLYKSSDDYETWSPSACSIASMTVVLNAYGKEVSFNDVLQTGIKVKAIDADLGLLESKGINRTAAKFGFETRKVEDMSVDEIVKETNAGTPAIVNLPPQDAWPGGHFLVVRGGDEDNVYLTDSSEYNIKKMSREEFAHEWNDIGIFITPKS